MPVPSLADDTSISKCIECGAPISSTAKFCLECGASQTRGVNPHQGIPSLEPSKPVSDRVLRVLLSIAVIFLGTIASLLAFQTFAHPPERWQYTVIAPSDENLMKDVDSWGAEGWEVVSSRRASSGEGANSKMSYELILKKRGQYAPSASSEAK